MHGTVNVKFVERDRPQMAIWCMCFACWVTKATNTHSGYVMLIAVPLQLWLHESALVLRNTYIACLVAAVFVVSFPCKLQKGFTMIDIKLFFFYVPFTV